MRVATAPPRGLTPALAGALVTGHVRDAQLVATILDLAARGALDFGPQARGRIPQIHLHDRSLVRQGYEDSVWRSLAEHASRSGVIPPASLGKVRTRWGLSREVLRRELVARGWYEPRMAPRRRPLYAVGTRALLLAVPSLGISVIGHSIWGLASAALLAVAGLAAVSTGAALPETTAAGEEVAAPWHAYRAELRRAGREARALDLGEALPYVVAMGVAAALRKHLKEGGDHGHALGWFATGRGTHTWDGGLASLSHSSSITDVAAGGSSGGDSASTGGGSSGGGF